MTLSNVCRAPWLTVSSMYMLPGIVRGCCMTFWLCEVLHMPCHNLWMCKLRYYICMRCDELHVFCDDNTQDCRSQHNALTQPMKWYQTNCIRKPLLWLGRYMHLLVALESDVRELTDGFVFTAHHLCFVYIRMAPWSALVSYRDDFISRSSVRSIKTFMY